MLRFAALFSLGLGLLSNGTNTPAQAQPGFSVIGTGRGIDHVVVAVHDLSLARKDFEALGFEVQPGGQPEAGLHNNAIFFNNRTYIELIGLDDKEPKVGDAADIAEFLKKGEGGVYVGLDVSSAKFAFQALKSRNFDVSDPDPSSFTREGDSKPLPTMWYTLGTPPKPAAGKRSYQLPIFFIDYLQEHGNDSTPIGKPVLHPNTAVGVHAVWFTVKDPAAQATILIDGGFEPANKPERIFNLEGKGFTAGAGLMVVLPLDLRNSKVIKALKDHDDGLIAVSVEVSDIRIAREKIQGSKPNSFKIYPGSFGKSFLVVPEKAHGVWIEFFQR